MLRGRQAQQPEVNRTELQRYDLSIPGREVIQVRVDLDPGVTFPKHSHPGEEIIYVLEGVWEYQVEGKAADDAQGRRSLVHPGWNDPWGEERRQRQRVRARDVYRRKGKPLVSWPSERPVK